MPCLQMIETKTCDICGKDKPIDKFPEYARFLEANSEKEVNVCRECE